MTNVERLSVRQFTPGMESTRIVGDKLAGKNAALSYTKTYLEVEGEKETRWKLMS